jgi:hypothetical protein
MSFYEGSARVPLVVRAPRLFSPGRVSTAVSTMDLLPTLVGLAYDGDASSTVGTLDGRSLLPHLTGTPDHDETVAEYLAEGAIAPIVMIRRGRHKFIHSPADPDQLFDVVDPNEQAWSPIPARPGWSRSSGARSQREGSSRRSTATCGSRSSDGSRSARRSAPAYRRRGTHPDVRRVAPLHPQPHGTQ